MRLDILCIRLHQRWRLGDDQEVLDVVLLCSLAEVETPRNYGRAIDDHHLAVCDRVLGIDARGDAGIEQKRGGTVLLGLVGLIEHGEDFDTTLVGLDERFGDRR